MQAFFLFLVILCLLILFSRNMGTRKQTLIVPYPWHNDYLGTGSMTKGAALRAGTGGSTLRVLGSEFTQPTQGTSMNLAAIAAQKAKLL